MKKPKTVICLDVTGGEFHLEDLDGFLRLGADGFEVGTTLLHAEGMGIITSLRQKLGETACIGVDLKTQDGCFFHLKRAKEYGGNYGTVCVANNKAAFITARQAQQELAVGIVADLYSVSTDEITGTAIKAMEHGFGEIRLNYGHDAFTFSDGALNECAGCEELIKAVGRERVSVACYSCAGALKATAYGVSKIVLCEPLIRTEQLKTVLQELKR